MPIVRLLNDEPHVSDPCGTVHDITVNDAFYRREPHWMRRYTALAMDNIRRQPVAFALASLYRIGRLFVIRGSGDISRAQQFTASRLIYGIGLAASLAVFLVFLAGVWIAWRRRDPLLWLLRADPLRPAHDLLRSDEHALLDHDAAVHFRLCRDRAPGCRIAAAVVSLTTVRRTGRLGKRRGSRAIESHQPAMSDTEVLLTAASSEPTEERTCR